MTELRAPEHLRGRMRHTLASLADRQERYRLVSRWTEEGHSLARIGEALGLRREAVRQIVNRGMPEHYTSFALGDAER